MRHRIVTQDQIPRLPAPSADRRLALVHARALSTAKPWRSSASTLSSASSGESSTQRTRSFTTFLPRRRPGRRFVEHEPVQADLANRFDELIEIDGFAHVTIDAQPIAFDQILFLFARGKDHRRQESRRLICADVLRALPGPLTFGRLRSSRISCGSPRARRCRGRTETHSACAPSVHDDDVVDDVILRERTLRQFDVVGIVLNEQNVRFASCALISGSVGRQRESRMSLRLDRTFRANPAAVTVNDSRHGRKADSGSLVLVAYHAAARTPRTACWRTPYQNRPRYLERRTRLRGFFRRSPAHAAV